MYVYMKQGVIGEQELSVKSYSKTKKCTYKCFDFLYLMTSLLFFTFGIMLSSQLGILCPVLHPPSAFKEHTLLTLSVPVSLIYSTVTNYRP